MRISSSGWYVWALRNGRWYKEAGPMTLGEAQTIMRSSMGPVIISPRSPVDRWGRLRKEHAHVTLTGTPYFARDKAKAKRRGDAGLAWAKEGRKPFAVMFNMNGKPHRQMRYIGKKPSRKTASFKTFKQAWTVAKKLSQKQKTAYFFVTHLKGSTSKVKSILHKGKSTRVETGKKAKKPKKAASSKRPSEPRLKPGERLWRVVSLTGSGFSPGMPKERGLIVAKNTSEAKRIANAKFGSRGTLVYLFKTYRQQQLKRGREGRWIDPETLIMYARRPAKKSAS